MGGQVQQPGTVPYYENLHGSHFSAGLQNGDATDAVMSRWLQSAGLQHLASPTTSPALDPRLLPNLLMQDYARHGVHGLEDRQKLYRLIKSMSNGGEHSAELFTSPPQGFGKQNVVDGLSSPELRGEISAGILDLHSIDDIELLSEDAVHEPFEASPFATISEKGYANEVLWSTSRPPISKLRNNGESSPMRAAILEKDITGTTNNLARIKVVVRKRPLNKKEIARKEEDIVTIDGSGCSLTVHEPKLKVDLTAYVEKHDFMFDAVLDDQVSNDEVYRVTVEPIIPTIFQRTKATCFAYGQTGSGKTFTMQPLPLRGCQDILDLMQHPTYKHQGLQLWLSFFEIYGGKLYDLLNERRKLCMREDGRQQVCIVGLKEFPVSDVDLVKDYIERGNASRSTGSTGANEESSRSHAILQLVIKKHSNKKEERGGKLVGKFSFIDLAGSERGADTTDNDRQTRIEGAEINKSLLALKECIRALDHEQGHIPFRGSKLTEVLRDSFVGDSRTVMISCISPNTGSCEHTLNTLRYADRVKGLSKNSNSKRDPSPNTVVQSQRELATSSPPLLSPESSDQIMDSRVAEISKRPIDQANWQGDFDGWSAVASTRGPITREDNRTASSSNDKDRVILKDSMSNSFNYQRDSSTDRVDQERVSPPGRKTVRDEKTEKNRAWILTDESRIDKNGAVARQASNKEDSVQNISNFRSRDTPDVLVSQNGYDGHITAILEEEEDLIAAHRLEVEDTMELVREEMKLLTEVDQPGSRIDRYVSQLSYVLSRKAAGIVNLQARLARFQRHLKEQEILSRNMSNARQ